MTEIRKTSETDIPFPHGWNDRLCYFELIGGELHWTKDRDEVRDAVRRAYLGESQLFCAWPGQYRTDLFLVDDLEVAAEALGAKLPGSVTPAVVLDAREMLAGGRITIEDAARILNVRLTELQAAVAAPPSDADLAELARRAAANAERRATAEKAAATRARNAAAKAAGAA